LEKQFDDANKQVLRIRCKYYHACVTVRELQDEEEVHDIEGSILYFNAEKTSSWQDAQRWMNVIDRAGIPLRLLVCHRIPPESHLFYQMAVEKQFELIELNPNPDDIEEGEEFGVRRIKSALEAHLWPNMELLGKHCCHTPEVVSADHIGGG
uniref:Photolyase/cryptochrome alpha/beta domain-containing protein n=1 Tax=Echinostoma caproni TaxID=27848 RepID=A0A183BF23_9TREM